MRYHYEKPAMYRNMKMKPIPTRTMGDLLRSEGYLVL